MESLNSWRRNKEPSVPINNIGLLAIYLYGLRESKQPRRLFYHRYTTESGVENTLCYPLYIASERWLANEERPLEIEEPISIGHEPNLPVDNEYLKWKRARQLVTNDPIYRLIGAESLLNGDLRLCFGEGTYEQYLSTCEILNDELLSQLAKDTALEELCRSRETMEQNPAQFGDFWEKLPLRQCLAPSQQALTNYKLRCVKLGINTTVAFRSSKSKDLKEDSWITLVSKRSPHLAEYPSFYGTIPAGTFQPRCSRSWSSGTALNRDEEFDPRYTLLREYMEEVFSRGRAETANLSPEQLPESKEAVELIKLAKEGKVRFAWTGFAIALETGKAELSCLLCVDDSRYYRKYEKMLSPNVETSQIIKVPCQEASISSFLADFPIAPAAAMALSLGLKVLAAPWFTPTEYDLLKEGTRLHKLA